MLSLGLWVWVGPMVMQQVQAAVDSGPKIIGLGVGRTGTQTLVKALEILGHKVVGDNELVWNWTFRKAFLNKEQHPDELMRLILEGGFTASMGLDEHAPWMWEAFGTSDAKAIMTIRSSEGYYRSVWRHNFYEARYHLDTFPDGLDRWNRNTGGRPSGFLFNFMYSFWYDDCYYGAFWHTEKQAQKCRRGFEQRNAERSALAPQGQLLEFDVKHGWGPLCKFLGVPVPEKPFPRFDGESLKTEPFQKWLRWFRLKTALQAAGYLGLLVVLPCGLFVGLACWCACRLLRTARAKRE